MNMATYILVSLIAVCVTLMLIEKLKPIFKHEEPEEPEENMKHILLKFQKPIKANWPITGARWYEGEKAFYVRLTDAATQRMGMVVGRDNKQIFTYPNPFKKRIEVNYNDHLFHLYKKDEFKEFARTIIAACSDLD